MEDKRRKIMRGAIQGVREFGLERLSMETVSWLSGAGTGFIHTIFNGKEDLLRCCFEEIDREIAGLFRWAGLDPLKIAEDPEREVRRVWACCYRYLVAHPDETVFYIRYRKNARFPEYDEARDHAHYAGLLEFARVFGGLYHISDRIRPELLWVRLIEDTANYARFVAQGRLPNDAATRESVFQLVLEGLQGELDMSAAVPRPAQR